MSRWSKNHTLKGGTSLYSLCVGVFRFASPSTGKVGSVGQMKKKLKNNFKVIQFL